MKEGGTKFFHALVYYGQKRESVLTLKPKLITKKIDMKSVFQMNEKLIHIVYMNDKEVAEEVFYHDLDESVFPKAGINLKVNEKQDIRHYLYFICFFLMTTESFKYEERYIYQLSSDLNTINKSSSYSMKTYTVPYNLKNIIKNSKKEDISIEISCAA